MTRNAMDRYSIRDDEDGPSLVCDRTACPWFISVTDMTLERLIEEASAHSERVHSQHR